MIEKTHKYLLLNYPMGDDLFIFSTRINKKAMLKIRELKYDEIFDIKNDVFIFLWVSKRTGIPHFIELSLFDNIDIVKEKINIVLKDAGKWYRNYLIWKEKQDFKGNPKTSLLKDFNQNLKGLKIISDDLDTEKGKQLVVFRGKIKVFNNIIKAFNWLINEMKIDNKFLHSGYINNMIFEITFEEEFQICDKSDLDNENDIVYSIGKLNGDIICKFNYICINGLYWLSGAYTKENYRGLGYGTKMIEKAVNKAGKIYFSNALYASHPDGDTRGLTDAGVGLKNSCLKKGVILNDWVYDPINY